MPSQQGRQDALGATQWSTQGSLGLSEGRVVRRHRGREERLHEDWTEGPVEVEEEAILPDGRGEVRGSQGFREGAHSRSSLQGSWVEGLGCQQGHILQQM